VTNLTTTQPAAFDALLALLQTAGAAQSPPVAVMDTEITQYQPGSYVIVEALEEQNFDPAALGSFAFYEEYEICGRTTVFQGVGDPATATKAVRDQTFAVHQAVVHATVIANSGAISTGGGQVLGSQAPTELEWIVPTYARYSSTPGAFGEGQAGLQGTIDWRYMLHARLTVG